MYRLDPWLHSLLTVTNSNLLAPFTTKANSFVYVISSSADPHSEQQGLINLQNARLSHVEISCEVCPCCLLQWISQQLMMARQCFIFLPTLPKANESLSSIRIYLHLKTLFYMIRAEVCLREDRSMVNVGKSIRPFDIKL